MTHQKSRSMELDRIILHFLSNWRRRKRRQRDRKKREDLGCVGYWGNQWLNKELKLFGENERKNKEEILGKPTKVEPNHSIICRNTTWLDHHSEEGPPHRLQFPPSQWFWTLMSSNLSQTLYSFDSTSCLQLLRSVYFYFYFFYTFRKVVNSLRSLQLWTSVIHNIGVNKI